MSLNFVKPNLIYLCYIAFGFFELMEFVRGMFLIDFIIKLDNYKLETTQFRERKILSPEENVIELGKVNYRSLSFSHFVVYRLYHYPAIVIAFLTLLLTLLNINGLSIRFKSSSRNFTYLHRVRKISLESLMLGITNITEKL